MFGHKRLSFSNVYLFNFDVTPKMCISGVQILTTPNKVINGLYNRTVSQHSRHSQTPMFYFSFTWQTIKLKVYYWEINKYLAFCATNTFFPYLCYFTIHCSANTKHAESWIRNFLNVSQTIPYHLFLFIIIVQNSCLLLSHSLLQNASFITVIRSRLQSKKEKI